MFSVTDSTLVEASQNDQQRLEEIISSLRPLLPIQNPMPFFVHNNPLQYWERFSFQEGIEKAVLTYENNPEIKSRMVWRDLEDFVIPLLLSYFDQGLNRWTVPSKKKGLWDWYCNYIEASFTLKSPALPLLKKQVKSLRTQSALAVILSNLDNLFSDRNDWPSHLQTLIFHFKGWSGMIQVLEKNPSLYPLQRYEVALLDWIAILVSAEAALRQQKKMGQQRLWNLSNVLSRRKQIQTRLKKIQKEEFFYYRSLIARFQSHIACQQQRRATEIAENSKIPAAVQVLFCIDDREESLRRALESVDPSYETFGTVGFFGVDFSLRRPGHVIFQPHCPPVVTPRKKAEEVNPSNDHSLLGKLRAFLPHLNESRFTPMEPILALFFWPFYMVALWLRSFAPKTYGQLREWLRLDSPLRSHNTIRFIESYSLEEKADLVRDILGGAGMTHVSAQFVMVLGHAATTTNNPFQKSYGCGACSGQSGFANAKVFAEFANDKAVRLELVKRGILIDEETYFLACCHDTCSDKIYFAPADESRMVDKRELFEKFKVDMEKALVLNADERWRQFSLSNSDSAIARSMDWSQPRPEFGHTGVALSVFGPRWLTKGLNLERRAFLVSYEPEMDPDGKNLAYDILSALPVCANINLDYFTSRAFPRALGAGSKLPLNIASGIGLMPGSKGDLQIGLATQMVDQHDPLRLLAFVFCDSEKLERVIAQSARLQNIIKNNWIHLVRIDPSTLKFEALTEELKNELSLTQ